MRHYKTYKTQSTGYAMHGFGMQYLSFNLKFAHICSLTALERYLPNQNPRQTAASLTTTKKAVKDQHASVLITCSANAIDN